MPFPVPSVSDQCPNLSAVATDPSWAGVSFVFDDAFWCDWLYREFDGLRVPRSLIRRPSRHGLPYPDRLSISPDPADPVQLENYAETLLAAQHLIVVVSPNSGRSELTREHMRAFRAAGGEERLVALVVKGEPGSPTAEPASEKDHEWLPLWLQWRFSENQFAAADRTEPLVIDARMGVATLPEVRSRLLAAMLEVDEAQLADLGVVPRSSTRPSFENPTAAPNASDGNVANQAQPVKGMGWMTATIALTSFCAVGGLLFVKMQQDAGRKTPIVESTAHSQTVVAESAWKPGEPLVAATPIEKPAPSPQPADRGPVLAVSTNWETGSREFKILIKRRDRLFVLAESRLEEGSHDEAYEIFKQTAEIAATAIRKSDAAGPHLIRAAEIARRLGQTAMRVGDSAESRKFYERGRQFIMEARKAGNAEGDGVAILQDIEAGLQKLSAK